MKAVATKADIQTGVSPDVKSGSNSGAWAAGGDLQAETDSRITLAGQPIALAASRAFAFAPAPDNKSVAVNTTVQLDARPTKLTVDGAPVLVDGDRADDAASSLSSPPNSLSVSSQHKLRTA